MNTPPARPAVAAALRWSPLVLAVALVAPALGSALYLDDWIYLTGARLLAGGGDVPLAEVTLPFFGGTVPAHQATHAYGAWAWLVPFFWLQDGDPPAAAMQLGSLAWLLLTLGSAAWLARRPAGDGAGAGWLLLATPPLLILAHRVMPDLPYTALCTLTLACAAAAVRAGDRGRRWGAALGLALAATAAWLVAYQALALLAAITVALPALPRARRGPLAAGVAVAWGTFALGQLYSVQVLGTAHLVLAGQWFSGTVDTDAFTLGVRAGALLGYLGAFGAPALALFFLRGGAWGFATRSTAGVALGVLALLYGLGWAGRLPAGVDSGWHALAIAGGAALAWMLLLALLEAARDLDALRAMAAGWGLATLAGSWLLLPAPLARYLLPVHVAAVVVAATWPRAARRGVAYRVERAVTAAIVLIWIALGLGLSLSDAARADATARLVAGMPAEQGTYFVGESGFRIAAEQRGMRYLLRADPAPEARLLHADVQPPDVHRVHPDLQGRIGRWSRQRETYLAPVAAVDWEGGADFYFPWCGATPFTFPGVGQVGAASARVAAPLPADVDAVLRCLEGTFVEGQGWPTYVRWSPDGEWEPIHAVFTTAEVVRGLSLLPPHPRVVALAEAGADALAADRNDDGSFSFYGRADRTGERPGRAWDITPDADDTARAMLALRARGRPTEPAHLALLAAQVEPDGAVRTWFAPPEQQRLTDSNRPDPVIAAVVLQALEGSAHEAERARIRAHLEAIREAGVPDETTYYAGPVIGVELDQALGRADAGSWLPPGKPGRLGCLPLQPTFYGAEEAGRPEYGSLAEPGAEWLVARYRADSW